MAINSIFCDFDGVLCSLDRQSAIETLETSNKLLMPAGEILDTYFYQNPLAYEIDNGVMSYSEMLITIQGDCWAGSTKSWLKKWEEIWVCYRQSLVLSKLLHVLEAIGCSVIIITDNHLEFRSWLKRHASASLASYGERLVCSAEIGISKPDPRIFEYALQMGESIVQTTCFIDDNLRNIQVANAMGFTTIHFTNELDVVKQMLRLNWQSIGEMHDD